MKRVVIPFAFLLALALVSSFSLADIAADDVRNLDPFNGIGISVSADVLYTPGNTHEIRISGSERDLRDLITEVEDGFLQVKYDNQRINRSRLSIEITGKELEAVIISGSARFETGKPVTSDEMELVVSGSGGITFGELTADELDVRISGSGNIELQSGSADELGVRISGSGKMVAERFEVSECSATISGSGNIRITVAEELDARISGSGKVYYHGDPQVNSISSGSGKVVSL